MGLLSSVKSSIIALANSFSNAFSKINWIDKIINLAFGLIAAYVLFYLIQENQDKRTLLASAKHAYFSQVFQKHSEILGSIVKIRQRAIELFDNAKDLNFGLRRKEFESRWFAISTEAKQNNSHSLIYLPSEYYDQLLSLDRALNEGMEELLKPRVNNNVVRERRNLISKNYDALIAISRELLMNDSLYYSIRKEIFQ